jgi:ectoine hydroxylase-related dioxygenase (phytanoyl-CoA dioxygenase family)
VNAVTDDRDFRFYGIKETNTATSEVDRYIEEISVSGFTVVSGVVAESELPEVHRRVDSIYEQQVSEIGGGQNLRAINDETIARCLLAYDDYFLKLATAPKIIALLERLLGDYFTLLQQNAIINLPDMVTYQTSWHRDLIYQHFIPSRPIAVSALICLDDFSKETGGTHVLPGTHKLEKFPSQAYVQRHEVAVNAKAGSAIVFDSMLFHRGGVNSSKHPRRGLNHLYSLPFIKQQIDLPRILGGKYADDDFLRKFLGYESQAAEDVVQWRTKRLKLLDKT